MITKQPRNRAIVFDFYNDRNLGPVPVFLSKVGKVLFTLFFICEIIIYFFNDYFSQGKVAPIYMDLLVWATGIGFLGGFLLLGIVGIYYIGLQKNMESFLPAFIHVMSKVGLYIFLPAAAMAGLLVGLAWVLKES